MKLAIATDDYRHVCGHVGRCIGFVILEVKNGEIISREERPNKFSHHVQNYTGGENEHIEGGSHSKLVNALSDCEYLICHSAGWRLVEDLKKMNIETIFTSVSDIEIAAKQMEKGELDINEKGSCHSH